MPDVPVPYGLSLRTVVTDGNFLDRNNNPSAEVAFMRTPKRQPLAKPAAAVKGRRTRIATAILVTWALVASIAFGWTWVADQRVEQQQRESIRATINRIVWDLSSEFFAASASTQALLVTQSLHYGWIGAVWLDDGQDPVTDLFVTTEGMTVVQALN